MFRRYNQTMKAEPQPVSNSARPAVAGVILAGGASRRMGSDKAMLRTAGRTQLEHLSSVLSAVLDTVVVSVRSRDDPRAFPQDLALVVDELPDAGPLAGIIAAHRQLPGRALLVVAVDLFGLDVAGIHAFLNARNSDPRCGVTALAVVPSASDPRPQTFPDPLCAIWEPEVLHAATDAFDRGERNPQVILRSTRVQLVADPANIVNVNTPEDLSAYSFGSQFGRTEYLSRKDPS